MAQHKKTPTFIRILSRNNIVICINPTHVASFQIQEKAKIKTGTKEKPEVVEADTIRFYLHSGTGFNYSVGIDITQEDFNYICATLLEFLYLNESEFQARSEAIAKEKMADWKKLSQDNEDKVKTTTEA